MESFDDSTIGVHFAVDGSESSWCILRLYALDVGIDNRVLGDILNMPEEECMGVVQIEFSRLTGWTVEGLV